MQLRALIKNLCSPGKQRQCQQSLLKGKLTIKPLSTLQKKVSLVKEERMVNLKYLDIHHICNLLLVDNNKSISKH